jgi:zinc transporter, ZIP family
VLEAFGWGAITAASLLIGSCVALRWKLPNKIVGWFMAFGAGALISAISFDLFEEAATTAERKSIVFVGLAIGALVYFGGDWMLDRRGGDGRKDIEGDQEGADGEGIVLGSVLDGIPESFVIGGSLVTGGSVSLAIVAAAFISNIPEGLASTAGLKTSGRSNREIVLLWIKIIIVSGISSLVGYLVLDKTSPDVGAFAQAFAAGAMLTMLADTMMPEAFEEGGKLVGLLTVLGFSVAVLISALN